MGWFEENPIVFVVLIVVTVETWSFLKRRVVAALSSRRARIERGG